MEGGCSDPYEQQLLAVFESCLAEGQSGLGEDGLRSLCDKLQLEERGKELISCLLERTPVRKSVTFYEFRDGLLALLGKAQEGIPDYSEREFPDDQPQGPDSARLATKKYGRRSKPKDQNADMVDFQHTNLGITDGARNEMWRNIELLNQDINSDEQRLRELWSKLNVATDGVAERSELTIVSHRIGMPTLPRQTIEQLFEKLDMDHDGRIGLDDFLMLFRNGKTLQDQLTSGWSDRSPTDVIKQNAEKDNIRTLGPQHTGYARSSIVVDMWEVAGVPEAATLLSDLGFTSPDVNLTELTNVLCDELKSLRYESDNRVMGTHISLLKAALILYQEEARSLNTLVEHLSGERDKLRVDIAEANQRASLLAQEVDEHHVRLEKTSQNQIKQLELKHTEVIKELTNQVSTEREANVATLKLMDQRLQTLQEEDQRIRTELTNVLGENQTLEMENQNLSDQVSKLKLSNGQLLVQVQTLAAEHDEVDDAEARENQQMVPLIDRINRLQSDITLLRDQNDELTSELEMLKGRDCDIKNPRQIVQMSSKSALEKSLPDDTEGETNMDDLKVMNARVAELERLLQENSQIESNGRKKGYEIQDQRLLQLNGLIGKTKKELANILTEKNNCTLENCTLRNRLSEVITRLDLNFLSEASLEELDSADNLANELEAECEERTSEPLRDFVIIRADKLNLGRRMSNSDDTIHDIDKNFNNFDTKCMSKNKMTSLRDYPPRREDHFADHLKCEKERSNVSYNLNQSDSTDKSAVNKLDNNSRDHTKDLETIKEILHEQEDKHASERKQLTERCCELERSVELLRTEYEQCEDYWAGKLDEERQLFEQEQRVSDEKFSELIAKMAEYEEQFGPGEKERNDGRLSPIEERFNLEQQYTDLEDEYKEWKARADEEQLQKDKEIKELRETLQKEKRPSTLDFCVQFPDENADVPLHRLASTLNRIPLEVSCSNEVAIRAKTVSLPAPNALPNITESDIDPSRTNEPLKLGQITETATRDSDLVVARPLRVISCLHGCSCHRIQAYTTAEDLCRVHREELRRLHQLKVTIDSECNSLTKQKEVLMQEILKLQSIRAVSAYCPQIDAGEQACRIDINVLQALNTRLQSQEQKTRHLQTSLKQQQQHTERILHQTWKQHRNEVTDLQFVLRCTQEKLQQQIQVYKEQADKLARADLLVTDLYVENAHLISSVERLEQHCHRLTQFSAESTSV